MNNEAVKIFADEWYERGNEDGDCQTFWLTLLRDVFNIDKPERLIEFQKPINGKRIDAYIAATKVLIEQKSFGLNLSEKFLQSDGIMLTPFEQAMRYADALPDNEKPRWIITSNFAEFRIYNLTKNLFENEATVIKLRELRWQFERLKFLIDPDADDTPPEEKISAEAAKIIEKICETFDKNYRKRTPEFRYDLGKLCTRLVFCFYADDAKIFPPDSKFTDYLKKFPPDKLQAALQKFFDVLNTPLELRGELDDTLKNFPYVNGGLFDEKIPIPPLNDNLKLTIISAHILKRGFNENVLFSWREISPPIFGAMFESVVSSQRVGGMYYTSSDIIHKVINPLFFDELCDEFEHVKRMTKRNRANALLELQDKISKLTFLDPACGSGNFLTETYIQLRRLENAILEELHGLKIKLPADPVKVSINRFFGIEIEPFAAAVAQTALWIAEHQMLQETEGRLGINLQALPLKNYATIVCGNSLRIDWHSVAPNVDYIIGNPPFVGARMKTSEQTADLQKVFSGWQNVGNLDYVTCWHKLATDFMKGNAVRAAFVSTNSVCQGDSIGTLWKNLFADGIHIDFCHRTFIWDSESTQKAHVHCVIVSFSTAPNSKPKIIFDGKKITVAKNINAYLVDGEDIFVESRPNPIQDFVPAMQFGNQPLDNKKYRFTPEEMDDFIKQEPAAEKYFHAWYGAEEFIKGKQRFCLYLGNVPPDEIKTMPLCLERVEAVKNFRFQSKRKGTIKLAATPTRFQVENFPRSNFLAVPQTSSERRQYIPMAFMDNSNFASEKLLIIPAAQIYHFGVLTSSIHMAWMRAVGGRLKSDYSYSIGIVYNNFIWCEATARQRRMIERSAQEILNVRAEFPDWTLAKLYNEDTMPAELRSAHHTNDFNVALAYGFEKFLDDEARIVAELMKLYQELTTA